MLRKMASGKAYTSISSVDVDIEAEPTNLVHAVPVDIHSVNENPGANPVESLTWSDTFFDDQDGLDTKPLAVFDYDLEQVRLLKAGKNSSAWAAAFSMFGMIGIFWIMAWGIWIAIPLIVVGLVCIFVSLDRHYRRITPLEDLQHTAVMPTGLRHVQLPCDGQSGYTIHIPFADIKNIIVKPSVENARCAVVSLCLASEDAGMEYITNGFYVFASHTCKGKVHAGLALIGLKEPVRFKRLLLAMRDRANQKPTDLTDRTESLLSRIEGILDNSSNNVPHFSRECWNDLVTELRDLKQAYYGSPEEHHLGNGASEV
jgi:hypothetical protein